MDTAISADGTRALTASFDNSVGYWDLGGDEVVWLEGHDAAVKTVTFAGEDRAASAGDDFKITLWNLENGKPHKVIEGHRGQIKSLAVSPDGSLLASASWDGSAKLWDMTTGRMVHHLNGHAGAVNDVAFSADGLSVFTASADGTIKSWDVSNGDENRTLVRHGFGVTTLLRGDGWLAYGAIDGGTRVIDTTNDSIIADLTLDRRPILAIAAAPDGSEMSVSDGQGYVMTVSTETWTITSDYQAAVEGPVWALAYTSDGASLLAGGIDDAAYIWPVDNELEAPIMATTKRSFQELPETMSNGERQFQRKCSICHSLSKDDERRAGPTLHGLIGREAGSVDGYEYSETVSNLGINWDADNIDQLFDLGPDHFIPGSKMPMQRITEPGDRRDLIEFLRENT